MRKTLYLFSVLIICSLMLYIVGCTNQASSEKKEEGTGEKKEMSSDDLIKRGNYLMITSGCHDCHTPKKFGPHGEMALDSSRLLSGHPSEQPPPPVNVSSLQPGQWMTMTDDLTTFVGPWGMSYTANLTPDSTSGIGTWTEDQFMSTIRNGKHLGNGRPIMPPMPWEFIRQMNDDDLKAIYAFLRSLPPIKNVVHAPYSPDDVKAMAAGK
jgi:mono/diheme cytochrome c family protein